MVRALKKVWVLVVDVGLGGGRLVSMSSIVWKSRGMVVSRVLPGWLGLMVEVGVRACILLRAP